MMKLNELSQDELLREAQRLQGENDALRTLEELRRKMEWAREEAQRVARLGIWEYDPTTGETWWSAGMWDLFGLSPTTEPPSWDEYLELLHPQDRPDVEAALAMSLRSGEAYEFEVRLRTSADSPTRWLSCQGGVLSKNGIRKLIGAITDVSARKKGELEQRGRNQVLDALIAGKSQDDILHQILKLLQSGRPEQISAILLSNPGTQHLHLEAHDGLPPAWESSMKKGVSLNLPIGPWVSATTENRLVIEENFSECVWAPLFPPLQIESSIRSGWAYPIPDAEGKVMGVCTLFSHEVNIPAEVDISLVKSLSSLVSVVINYKRDEAALAAQAHHTKSLLHLSAQLDLARDYESVIDVVHQEIKETLGYQTSWLYLYSEDRKKLRMVATRGRKGGNRPEDMRELDSDEDAFVKALSEVKDLWIIPDARTHPLTDKQMVESLGNRVIINMPIGILDTSLGIIGAGTFGDEPSILPTSSQQLYWQQLAKYTGAALDRIQYLKELENSRNYLQRANEQLEAKVSSRTRELELSLRSVEHFSYLASHDLQEPLRMIVSYLQLLERRIEGKLDPEEKEFLDFAVLGARRMKELLNGILAYFRLKNQSGQKELVKLNEIVDTVSQGLRSKIEMEDASLEVGPLPTLTAVPQQMLLLFQHLIDNALKFHSEAPPRIHIQAELQQNYWLFAIRDNGIGFEQDQAQRIFLIFQRLHNRGKYSGNGVGLAVCREIVQVHGGTIWAESGPGEGCSIYFRLKNE